MCVLYVFYILFVVNCVSVLNKGINVQCCVCQAQRGGRGWNMHYHRYLLTVVNDISSVVSSAVHCVCVLSYPCTYYLVMGFSCVFMINSLKVVIVLYALI